MNPESHEGRVWIDEAPARCEVGGVSFVISTLDRATRDIISFGKRRVSIPIFLSNAYCVALAGRDSAYRELLSSSGRTYADGTPIAWAIRAFAGRGARNSRVRGPSLFPAVIDEGRSAELRHFFLGTTESTLGALTLVVNNEFPGAVVSGVYAPPYGPLDEGFYSDAVERIRDAQPEIVWVALGTPKQDWAAAELARRCGLPCVAVGAAFDFMAGVTPEAPVIFRRIGFEWAYRLFKEPRRLWRRYLIGNFVFMYLVARQAAMQVRMGEDRRTASRVADDENPEVSVRDRK
ncbi:WecB/TagA/CpsF family glycosyltransferase [Rhodococcus pyridinivorans]